MKKLMISLLVAGVLVGILLFAGAAGASQPDHYLFYKASARERDHVTLADQFATKLFKVKNLKELGAPASKTPGAFSYEVLHEDIHLTRYKIKRARGEPRHVRVDKRVVNQFGEIVVEVRKPDRLMVPAAKELDLHHPEVDPPDPETLDDLDFDHYTCYRIKLRGEFERIQVRVEDQFTPGKIVEVVKPTRLCAPVEKTHDGHVFLPIQNPDIHLMCYKVKLLGEKNDRVRRVFVGDQFDPERRIRLDTRKPRELCVPSQKFDP